MIVSPLEPYNEKIKEFVEDSSCAHESDEPIYVAVMMVVAKQKGKDPIQEKDDEFITNHFMETRSTTRGNALHMHTNSKGIPRSPSMRLEMSQFRRRDSLMFNLAR